MCVCPNDCVYAWKWPKWPIYNAFIPGQMRHANTKIPNVLIKFSNGSRKERLFRFSGQNLLAVKIYFKIFSLNSSITVNSPMILISGKSTSMRKNTLNYVKSVWECVLRTSYVLNEFGFQKRYASYVEKNWTLNKIDH